MTALEHTVGELVKWREAIAESTEVNRQMVEVGQNILQALGWVGVAAKWISMVAAAFAAMWIGMKWVIQLGIR